jgi:hypothetical protein
MYFLCVVLCTLKVQSTKYKKYNFHPDNMHPKRKIILAINIGQREYKHKHSSGTKLFQRVVAQLPISCIIDVFIH